MKPAKFAPVAIPTLCRVEHLKNCVKSLMKCNGAEFTDLYIAVDYPSRPKHFAGWEEINVWLSDLENSHCFHSVNIIRRDKNLGVGKNGNLDQLISEVFLHHDRIIVSEDDNVFSGAFLEFINKGLDKFESDNSVFAINGYRHLYDVRFDDNNFYRQNVDFSAWGYGMWRDRREELMAAATSGYWRRKALNPMNWWRAYRNGLNRFSGYMSLIRHVIEFADNAFGVYMAVNEKDVIMPKVSMVRNTGWDGSGEHCNKEGENLASQHMQQEIYSNDDFDYVGNGREHYKDNHNTYVSQSYGRISFMELVTNMANKIKRVFGFK